MASYLSKSEEDMIQHLTQLFGDRLDKEIINSVALSCGFDLVTSTNALKAMYSSIVLPEDNKKEKFKSKHTRHALVNNFSKNSTAQKSEKERDLEEIIQLIKDGSKVLILLRGLPGSGKSHLAKKIVTESVGSIYFKQCILSTDDYFFTSKGMYKYDVTKLQEAHATNQRRAYLAMQSGVSPVIIDNTNTEMWEMKPYVSIAVTFSYIVKILEPFTSWTFNDKELARRNTHGVPRIKIKQMMEKYQRNITPEDIMMRFSLRYHPGAVFHPRSYPPFASPSSHHSSQKTELNMPKQYKNRVEPSAPDVLSKSFTWESAQNYDYFDANCAKTSHEKTKSEDETQNKMTVDDLLMCGLQDSTADILQPNFSGKGNSVYPNLNIEEAWGISEKAIVSWDIVTPITDTKPKNVEVVKITAVTPPKPEHKDACTNTFSQDFLILSNNVSGDYEKILFCTNRDISEGLNSPLLYPPQKLTVHKSTMTDEIAEFLEVETKSKASDLRQLMALFPNVSIEALNDIYEKCNGDMNWIVDLLLDDSKVPISTEVVEAKGTTKVTETNPFSMLFDEIKGVLSSSLDNLVKPTENNKNGNSAGSSFEEVEAATEATESDDFDDFEFVQGLDLNEGSEEQETVELNLGNDLISQLEFQFGDSGLFCPKGFKPHVQVPMSLARQLYTFYVESVYQQMENDMVKKDEEFARKLVEQEQDIVKIRAAFVGQSTSNQGEQENQWKNLSPDDIATKLTKQKLCCLFPTIEENQLYEIYQAHNNDYKETVNVLLASTNSKLSNSDEKIFETPISEEIVDEMKRTEIEMKQVADAIVELRPAQSYRDEAFTFLEKREELYQKAQAAYQRGMPQVAQFYSNLAQQQTKLYDQANNMAAAAFLNEHSERHQNFDTIDLHFLFVKEAMAALDIFIDRNINLLQGSDKRMQFLYVITGRGKRSENGKSKLKPAVIARLKKRKINYCHLNPGLLKIKVMQGSLVTSDV